MSIIKKILLTFTLYIYSNISFAVFGADDINIQKFCETKEKSPRQTIIYVDHSNLDKNNTQWARDLVSALTANLMPSERITVAQLSPQTASVREIWSACYPNYTDVQLKRFQSEGSSFFGEDPLKQLKNQQAIFRKQLGDSFGKIISNASQKLNPETASKKQIIRAISNDGYRFDTSLGSIRVVIYSDMMENSDLGNALQPYNRPDVSLNFKNAMVYIFGVTVQGLNPQNSSTTKKYWEELIPSFEGHISSFGENLILPHSTPKQRYDYDLTLSILKNKDERIGHLQIFVDQDKHIQDSFISIGNISSTLRDGTLSCSDDSNCTFIATTDRSVMTKEGINEIKLSGSLDKLSGSISVPNAKLPNGTDAKFTLTLTRIKDGA